MMVVKNEKFILEVSLGEIWPNHSHPCCCCKTRINLIIFMYSKKKRKKPNNIHALKMEGVWRLLLDQFLMLSLLYRWRLAEACRAGLLITIHHEWSNVDLESDGSVLVSTLTHNSLDGSIVLLSVKL